MNKVILTYNHLFFTEKSKENWGNLDFWQSISALEERYPSDMLIVKRILRHNNAFNRYFEDVLLESDSPILLKQANGIYRDHYYISLLELFEDTPEINAVLMGEVWRDTENS